MALVNSTDLKNALSRNDTVDDALFTTIAGWADEITKDFLGRDPENQTFTEYHDGTGHDILWLARGPITAIGSAEHVTRDSSGNESVQLTLTENSDFFAYGKAADNQVSPGYLKHSSYWVTGERNYKVIYEAGWSSADMPPSITSAAVMIGVWLWNKRADFGVTERDAGDGSVMKMRAEIELRDTMLARLHRYLDPEDVPPTLSKGRRV